MEYKKKHLDLLWVRIHQRVKDLREEGVSLKHYLVPGAGALLERLKERSLKMYLASGTDEII